MIKWHVTGIVFSISNFNFFFENELLVSSFRSIQIYLKIDNVKIIKWHEHGVLSSIYSVFEGNIL